MNLSFSSGCRGLHPSGETVTAQYILSRTELTPPHGSSPRKGSLRLTFHLCWKSNTFGNASVLVCWSCCKGTLQTGCSNNRTVFLYHAGGWKLESRAAAGLVSRGLAPWLAVGCPFAMSSCGLLCAAPRCPNAAFNKDAVGSH